MRSASRPAGWNTRIPRTRGIVHRDIKPANLLLDNKGTLKILDMGLARLDTAGAMQDDLTGSGQIMGNSRLHGPRAGSDTKRADHRADIYSLGVTLWFLLTGKPMYTGETPIEKLMAHQTQPIPSIRGACPAVPPALDAVFQRMVAKEGAGRAYLRRWANAWRLAALPGQFGCVGPVGRVRHGREHAARSDVA